MKQRKMDAAEIAAKYGMSVRHAYRLINEGDSRIYTDSFSTQEHPTPQRPDLLECLRDWADQHSDLSVRTYWRLSSCKVFEKVLADDFSNIPTNIDEILAAVRAVSKARRRLEDAIGFYYEDEPDGTQNNGLPTIYQRAVLGLPIHEGYRKQVERWAKKYNQTINPECFWRWNDKLGRPVFTHKEKRN